MISIDFRRLGRLNPRRRTLAPKAPMSGKVSAMEAPTTASLRAHILRLSLGSWMLVLALVPLASVSPAAEPLMVPSPAAILGTGSPCLDGDFGEYFNANWSRVLPHLAKKTRKEFAKRTSGRTYNLAARTDPFLSAAITCDEIPLFENMLDLYALAYSDLETQRFVFLSGLGPSYLKKYSDRRLSFPARMWVHEVSDEKTGSPRGSDPYFLPVENPLGSAKLVRAIARSISYISQLPTSMRTERMRRFAAAYWEVVAFEHLARWVFLGPGEFQPVKGTLCKTALERYNLSNYFERLFLRKFSAPPGGVSRSYCNALTDRDLIMINAAVEVLAANAADPGIARLDATTRMELETLIRISEHLLEDRVSSTRLSTRFGGELEGMLVDRGLWDDHDDYRFAQDDREDRLPHPREVPAVATANIGWEFNHSKSLLTLLRAFWEYRSLGLLPSLSVDYPAKTMLYRLADQVAHKVVRRDGAYPAFTSYMDGSDGWYRVRSSEDYESIGFCPSCRSDAYYNGGWAMLEQFSVDLEEINWTLAHMLRVAYTKDRGLVVESEFNEVRAFMRRYYGVVVRDSGGVIERVPKDYGIGNVPALDRATPSARLHPAQLRTVLAAIARFAR